MESEYTKCFDSIAKECDMSEISEHALGAVFWDKQQQKIDKLEKRLEKIAGMCGNPDAIDACRLILKEIKQ